MEKSQEYDNLKEGDYVIIKTKEVYHSVGEITKARIYYDELDVYFEYWSMVKQSKEEIQKKYNL